MPNIKGTPIRRGTSPTLKLVSVMQALLVAECGSFRSAAAILGIRQSAVSRRIRLLEDELGISLFERHRAGVRETNGGRRFLQQAADALSQFDQAVEMAGAAGAGAIGELRIGILSSMAAGYLRELLRIYHSRYPGVSVRVSENASAANLAGLRRRQLDIAFFASTAFAKDCDAIDLWSEQIFVALPEQHVLSAKAEIAWADLQDEHLMVRALDSERVLCSEITRRLQHDDHSTRIEKIAVGREGLMHLVAMGFGFALTTEATSAMSFPEVVFRPVGGKDDRLQFSAAWLPHNDNPALRRFLSLARTLVKEKQRELQEGVVASPPITGGINSGFAFLAVLGQRLGLST